MNLDRSAKVDESARQPVQQPPKEQPPRTTSRPAARCTVVERESPSPSTSAYQPGSSQQPSALRDSVEQREDFRVSETASNDSVIEDSQTSGEESQHRDPHEHDE